MIKKDKIGQNKMKIVFQKIEFLLQHVAESIAQTLQIGQTLLLKNFGSRFLKRLILC